MWRLQQAPFGVTMGGMVPLANILRWLLPRPLAHGAVGFWDEMLNIIPLILGAGLLAYLYFGQRKRRAAAQPPAEADPLAPPSAGPPAPPQP